MENKKLNWKFESPDSPGFHEVVSPNNSDCTTAWGFRLNLEKGSVFELIDKNLELNGVVISGDADIHFKSKKYTLSERDSVYLPGDQKIEIQAKSNLVMFFGALLLKTKVNFLCGNMI